MVFSFGVYLSLVGVAVVFITLLAVATASEVLRRLLTEGAEASQAEPDKRARVAAVAAVCCYIGMERRPPRLRAAAEASRWSAVARVEALGIGDRSR